MLDAPDLLPEREVGESVVPAAGCCGITSQLPTFLGCAQYLRPDASVSRTGLTLRSAFDYGAQQGHHTAVPSNKLSLKHMTDQSMHGHLIRSQTRWWYSFGRCSCKHDLPEGVVA